MQEKYILNLILCSKLLETAGTGQIKARSPMFNAGLLYAPFYMLAGTQQTEPLFAASSSVGRKESGIETMPGTRSQILWTPSPKW